MDMESEEPKTTINLCQLMPVNFSIRVDRGEFNKLHHLLYHQWSLWQYSEKELWFLQTWNLMTCKLTKLCMEKLLQVAELGGSNGQRNFSCMDGHLPDIGKCANSCTLLSLDHGWNDLKKPTRGMSVFLFLV
jgi:hypothetical protein